ncbi:MAG TPA: hypothetical protein PL041_02065 [Melioribacteraceae bacterium]|nr:hypothetical protein [Melioribacteraceae bacterium]
MLKKCPVCGKPIDSLANECKFCKTKLIDINAKFVWQETVANYKTNKNGVITILLILIVSLLLFLGVYFYPILTDAKDWQYTVSLNNEEAYLDYINKHKNGAYIHEAWNVIDNCCWQKVIEKNNEKSYLLYLQKFPKGKYKDKAKKYADELAWKNACESGDTILIKQYIKNHPRGIFIECAKLMLKKISR